MNDRDRQLPPNVRIEFPLLGESPWKGNINNVIRSRLARLNVGPSPIPSFSERPPLPSSKWQAFRVRIRWLWNNYRCRAVCLWAVTTVLCAAYWFVLAPEVVMSAKDSAANAMFSSLATILAILVTIGVFSFSRLADTESELSRIRARYENVLYRRPDSENVKALRSEIRSALDEAMKNPAWHPAFGMYRLWIDFTILEYNWFARPQDILMPNELLEEIKELGFIETEAQNICDILINQHVWMKEDPTRFFEFLTDALRFCGRYLVQAAPALLSDERPVLNMLKTLDDMFHADKYMGY